MPVTDRTASIELQLRHRQRGVVTCDAPQVPSEGGALLLRRAPVASIDERLSLTKTHAELSKTLEAFDWAFQKNLNRALVENLATLGFIDNRDDLLITGKSGTGKTTVTLAAGGASGSRVPAARAPDVAVRSNQIRPGSPVLPGAGLRISLPRHTDTPVPCPALGQLISWPHGRFLLTTHRRPKSCGRESTAIIVDSAMCSSSALDQRGDRVLSRAIANRRTARSTTRPKLAC